MTWIAPLNSAKEGTQVNTILGAQGRSDLITQDGCLQALGALSGIAAEEGCPNPETILRWW